MTGERTGKGRSAAAARPSARARPRSDEDQAGPAFTLTILLQHTGKLLDDLLRRGFDDLGLHPAQGQVLHLLEWGDGVSQRSLTSMMNIAAPTVSGILKRMDEAGLIERRVDTEDERVVRVLLTRKGRRKGAAARALVDEVEQVLIAGLTRTQLRSSHRLLRKLRDNLGGSAPGSEPTVETIVP